MRQPGYIGQPWNQILAQKHQQLPRAQRIALGTLCDPTGRPLPPPPAQFRKQLKRIQINAATAGDNIVIPALAGVKQIYELQMWNVTGQTIIWQQGLTGSDGTIVQTRITDCPSLFGFTLGFNGNPDMPHWEIDNGQPLVINLSVGTQVDGFIVYRVQNGTGN